ncbi:MAG: SpoIIE family protein phosphatase [Actinomycetota bacterium]
MSEQANEASMGTNAASGGPPGAGLEGIARLRFLADATELLATSPNEWVALERLATMAVPELADWCAIDVVDHAGKLRRAAVVHADAEKIEWVRELEKRYPPDPNSPFGVPKVIRTGEPEFYPEIPEPLIREGTQDEEQLSLILGLGLCSAMIVPFLARGRSLGAITLVTAESGRVYTAQDLELAEAIARRAGLAVDRSRLRDEVEESEHRFEALVDSLDAIVWEAHSATLQPFYVSRRAEDILGYPAERWVKEPGFWETIIHPDDRDVVVRARRAAVEERRRYDIEYRASADDGRILWLRELGDTVDEDDGPQVRGIIVDVTVRVDALTALNESRERLAFLAEASALLSSSLNYRAVLERLASLTVPRAADWCAVDVAEEDGTLRRVAVVHFDPSKTDAARRLKEMPSDEEHVRVLRTVMETGMALLDVDGSEVCSTSDPDRRLLLDELGVGSAIVVPLLARGRTLGAVKLVLVPGGRTYGQADVTLAQDLARRAALAVDNARLFQDRSHVARTLQRSLLPPHLPQIPGVELAARYHAAGEGSEVGGDFYDVFRTGKDDWAILIGDVCGKGADAAALTALARYTVRAAAMQARKPSRVLTQLNEALVTAAVPEHGLDLRFCTVAYTRLRPMDIGVRVTSTAGGHPPPYILRRDGRVETACRTGTLIGVLPEIDLTDHSTELQPGDALILYTDGVTEARGPSGDFGEAAFQELVSTCAGLDASSIAERIESTVLEFQGGEPRDDIALIVVRVPY